jgi:ribosomal protein S4
MSINKKKRLDRLLVDKNLAATLSRAMDLIRLGAVSVEGVKALKPGAMLTPDASLSVAPDASPFVSRGGLKLAAALDAFGLDPRGRIALVKLSGAEVRLPPGAFLQASREAEWHRHLHLRARWRRRGGCLRAG